MAAAPAPRRGEIWLIDFDPVVGQITPAQMDEITWAIALCIGLP